MFKVEYSNDNGGLRSLIIRQDEYEMNWVEGERTFGVPRFLLQTQFNRFEELAFVSVDIDGDVCKAVYANPYVKVEVIRKNGDRYIESYVITNTSANEIFFASDRTGIDMPFTSR